MTIPTKLIAGVFAGLLALVTTSQAATLKFDFGTQDSAVFPGFHRVSEKTLFTEDASFGFVKTVPASYDRLRPNPLMADFLWSKGKTSFRVNLPSGSYRAWILYGDSHYGARIITPMPLDYRVAVNGQEVLSDPIDGWKEFYTEKYFFRGYSDIYHADDDFYKKYVLSKFKEKTVSFEAREGRAIFEFTDIPVNALIIYPADEAAEVEDDIAYLHKELRRHTIIRETKTATLNPEPEYSLQDKQRGYVVYGNFPSEPPLPAERPLKERIDPTPSTFLAAGQKGNLSFTILPLRDLKDVKVDISDLVDKSSGSTISADSIKIEQIAHHETAVTDSRTRRLKTISYDYEVKPLFIKPFPDSFDLMDEGINRTVLIGIEAAQGARAGIYEGIVNISSESAPAYRMPVRVRILPFALPELPILAGRYDMGYDFYYYYYWNKTFTDEEFEKFVWEREKKRMAWAKEMGLNSISLSDDMRGDFLDDPVRLNPDGRMAKWMDLYRDMGLKAMPWYGFQALTSSSSNFQNLGKNRFSPEWKTKYHQLIASIRDMGTERGWPEIVFYLSDELSNRGSEGGEDGLKRAEAVKGLKGIRTLSSVNGKYEHALIGKVDILMPNFAFPITEPILDEMKSKGTELWLYNVTDTRFTWGYYPFLTRAKGRFQWYGNYGSGYPFNEFDATSPDSLFDAYVAGPEGPISMVNALDMREGLDDLRYVTLLNRLVEQSKDPRSKAVREAKAILAEINALSVDLRTYGEGEVDATGTGLNTAKAWTPEQCERMRWRIADCIIELQK